MPQPLQQQQFTAGGVEPTTPVPSMNGAATVLPQSPQQFAQQQQQQQQTIGAGVGAAVPGYTYATAVGIGWAHTAPATFTNSAISSATSKWAEHIQPFLLFMHSP